MELRMIGLEARPGTARETEIVRRCGTSRRKSTVVVQLLQGLAVRKIAPHSRFAVMRRFPAEPLGRMGANMVYNGVEHSLITASAEALDVLRHAYELGGHQGRAATPAGGA